ncbi:CoA transferase [Brachybacterium sacelli]|uniref:CoA transferase n=1 Tax=Brachybacterium sacelli TaxID=173364 RepID=A0ABS4X4S9_9MICO|nr:hypothetical protein [Brachybacterium sacelli]
MEHLAWSAVTAVRDAAAELAAARGLDLTIDTTAELVAASFAALENLRMDGHAPTAWGELSGFVAARDGWVRLHGNYPHHATILREVLGADRASLERAVSHRDAAEVEHAIAHAGGIAVAVRTREEWEAHPHARATAEAPWSEVVVRGERPALGHVGAVRVAGEEAAGGRDRAPRSPLRGVRVLDLTRVIAGPTGSQLLACLGADVLRLDPPHRPEILDQHRSTGMGKRSAVVDLRREAERVRTLAAGADVILDGYRPGALAGLGLGTADLEELAPQAILVSLSAWGETGPWGSRAGFDSIVQAATGIADCCGTSDHPGALPVQALDHTTGHLLAAHVLEALARRQAATIHMNLLGAARTLLAAPPAPATPPTPLEVPRVRFDEVDGSLDLVPPPLLIDGRTVERPVGRYGAARPEWIR